MTAWFRWHNGTTEDGKFRVIARNAGVTVRDVIALWAFILEDASSNAHRGVCERNEDFMQSILDFEDGVVERILGEMDAARMVSVGAGAITVVNWGKRQFETDRTDNTNAERQRRFREKQKQKRNGVVTATKPPDTDNRIQNTERKNKKEPTSSAPPSKSEDAQLYERGKTILGSNSGGIIKKLIDAKDGNIALARSAIETASTKSDPREYIGGVIRGAKRDQDSFYDPRAGIL